MVKPRQRARRGPALVEASARIELPADRPARIIAVADTHSAPHPQAAARIAALAPDLILHGGDIGDLAVLAALAELAPVHAVRGNIDTRAHQLPDVLLLDLVRSGCAPLRVLLTHIALYGPTLRAEVAGRARAAGAPLVVCGHSHVPFLGGPRDVTVFNPGSIGPRRFHLPIVFGRIDLDLAGRINLAHVDVETGATWMPP
jgi:putative phosphoesterase